jgi:dTDP-4-dehydrorhamnose reductase
MSKILVTGSKGQLGSEIRDLAGEDPRYCFTDKEELDITSKEDIARFIGSNDIRTIINCAAYTAVDRAETDQENAERINHLAVRYLSEIAREYDVRLIHISTDYVFDGTNYRPYVEKNSVNPNSVYGRTKLEGERTMQAINPKNSLIIRTSWVYSSYGSNFVKTMLRLGRERDELGVIFDQVGTPTYARDLAQAILTILPKIESENVEIYHYSNEGVLSWYDFAKAIMEMAKIECRINPIETKDYPTPAHRPHYSLLNKSRIKETFDIEIPYWRDGLDVCLKRMGEKT